MPEVGRHPALLSHWYVPEGGQVVEGDRLVEVLVGHAAVTISAPATGRLAVRAALANDPVMPGQLLGYVEAE